jgi:spermidine/putrescine transport system ATP-binding protein
VLTIENIFKTYEKELLLKGVSFSVRPHETVCLLGASGSGKSTLLRIIAGLEEAESGRVLWNGQDQKQIPVHQRNFGLMFQDYALFPHRTVAENVAFGLRMQKKGRQEIESRVQQALEQVNMQSFANRRVTDLSGGEQQRVALARALAPRPRLLMLDEPLGALDRSLREQLIDELRGLLHATGIPAIYVTHDQEEAFAIADRLVLLHDGKIEQDDTPYHVYFHPATPWVAKFMGIANLVEGKVTQSEPLQVQTSLGLFCPRGNEAHFEAGEEILLLFRPNSAQPVQKGAENVMEGTIKDVVFHGHNFRVEISAANRTALHFDLEGDFKPGEHIRLAVQSTGILCFRAKGN